MSNFQGDFLAAVAGTFAPGGVNTMPMGTLRTGEERCFPYGFMGKPWDDDVIKKTVVFPMTDPWKNG